ncbi:MAG: transcriptional repressor [Rhodospirillales bacterium]|jgi:Fur family peroxide stress response transcriptional regulator|nr:transcriptional repressor [Rhodospirillales bacterium]
MKRFERVCREAGAKLTHQRIEIFREVAKTGDHPDAEMILRRVRGRMPTVSLDTIYRTLWLLVDLGLIQTLGPGRERARFDANLDHHHHFVCVKCGMTRDFYSKDFDELALPDSLRTFGRVDATHVEARGLCLECARQDTAPPARAMNREE